MHGLVDALRAKKPDAAFFKMDAEHWSADKLEEFIHSMGLFEQKYIVVLDNVFENKDAKEFVVRNVKTVADSDNIFILLEGKLDKKTVATLEGTAQKVLVFSQKEVKKKPELNIFSLGDALGRRNKKELWLLFQKARSAGLSHEEIHGTLFWMVKSMLLAQSAPSAKDAGLSPFVFKKAKSFAKNFSEEELKTLSSRLVSIYHDARGGGMELALALEIFILSL